MRLKALVLAFALVIFASMPTKATIIDVPGDSSTIQGGINGASNGDTVLVAKGHYYERISFKGKAILVASDFIYDGSPATIDSTIIDANPESLGVADTGSVVRFVNQEDSNSIIKGFTIQNGVGTISTYNQRCGGGIFCDSSSSTIANNIIKDNSALFGGGINCYWYSSPTINNNKIVDNSASAAVGGYGGGICCYEYSSPNIDKNKITGNFANDAGGGIYCEEFSSPTITEDTITNNSASGGAGIYCGQHTTSTIKNNLITNDSAGYAGGIYCNTANVSISNNIITDNYGDGIYVTDCSPTITHNTIDSTKNGDGIYLQDWSFPTVTNSIITNTTGGYGINCNPNHAVPAVSFTNVWNNASGNFGCSPAGAGDTTWGTNFNGTPCDSFFNIIRDPWFANTTDYELACTSLCIEAGDSVSTPPSKSGCRVDMGASEYYNGFICGDVDSSGVVNSSDCDYLTSYIFRSGPSPRPLASADVNHNGIVNVSDLVYLINYVYKSGPPPCCPACL